MNSKRSGVLIVAALVGLALLACSNGGGQGSEEAGAPSSGPTCGAGGPAAVAALAAFPALATPDGTDAGAASPITGTATFAATGVGVDLTISITGCVDGDAYPVVIHQGATCASAALQGPDWDPPRGDGIAALTCTGNSGLGRLYYSRLNTDAKPWSVGAPSSSDVLGHVLVIHDPASMRPLACGAIAAAPADAGASPAASSSDARALPSAFVRAQLAGLCEYAAISSGGQCPDPQKLSDCACTHCGLSACLGPCSNYASCLGAERDAGCASSCAMDPACETCTSGLMGCVLGFCLDAVSCAVPTPGGPCSKVEACCALQGPRAAQCLAEVQKLEKLGGDATCIGTMYDQDFLTHVAYDPPCNFDQ